MNKGEVKGIRVFDVFFPSKTNLMRVLGYKFCPSFKDEKEIEEWLMKRFNLDDRAYLAELLKSLKDKYAKYLIEKRFERHKFKRF